MGPFVCPVGLLRQSVAPDDVHLIDCGRRRYFSVGCRVHGRHSSSLRSSMNRLTDGPLEHTIAPTRPEPTMCCFLCANATPKVLRRRPVVQHPADAAKDAAPIIQWLAAQRVSQSTRNPFSQPVHLLVCRCRADGVRCVNSVTVALGQVPAQLVGRVRRSSCSTIGFG